MPTRREQAQSYQFMMQRVVSAFAHQDTDPVQPAGRRLLGAGLAGVMVAVLCLAAVGVYAVLRPGGSTGWRDGASVIVEKETGTRYVFRGGVLYPMANYASAVLALGASTKVVQVAGRSLLGVPRGPLSGIVGAPDALPPADRLLGTPWTICAEPARDGSGQPATLTSLRVGQPVRSGRPLGEEALLVTAAETGRLFLIWHQRRYEIVDDGAVVTALGLAQQSRVPVNAALLDALPAGAPLAARPVAGRGTPSTAVAGARVGQVLYVDNAGTPRQYFVVADSRALAPITPVEANILLADPATQAAYPGEGPQPRPLSPAQAATAEKQPPAARTDGSPPASPPRMAPSATTSSAICAQFVDATGAPELVVDVPVADAAVGSALPRRSADGVALADRIEVAPGRAAIVEAMPSADATVGTRYLVTDLGARHLLSQPELQQLFGYGGVTPARLPSSLVARVPMGPALDLVRAREPVLG
jgi:type VII secretion protein EccB